MNNTQILLYLPKQAQNWWQMVVQVLVERCVFLYFITPSQAVQEALIHCHFSELMQQQSPYLCCLSERVSVPYVEAIQIFHTHGSACCIHMVLQRYTMNLIE